MRSGIEDGRCAKTGRGWGVGVGYGSLKRAEAGEKPLIAGGGGEGGGVK